MGRAGIRYSICRAYLRLLYTGKELTSECRGHEVFSLSSRLVMAKAKESGPVKDFAWLCATLMIKTCPVPDPKPWGSSPRPGAPAACSLCRHAAERGPLPCSLHPLPRGVTVVAPRLSSPAPPLPACSHAAPTQPGSLRATGRVPSRALLPPVSSPTPVSFVKLFSALHTHLNACTERLGCTRPTPSFQKLRGPVALPARHPLGPAPRCLRPPLCQYLSSREPLSRQPSRTPNM